jgi:hypothetical protein
MSTQSIRLMRSIIALVAGIAIAISLIAFYYYIIPLVPREKRNGSYGAACGWVVVTNLTVIMSCIVEIICNVVESYVSSFDIQDSVERVETEGKKVV